MLLRDDAEDTPKGVMIKRGAIEEVGGKHHVNTDHRVDKQH